MSSFIARSEDDSGELYGWWDGESVEAEDQVRCNADEVAVFWDGEAVVTTLGPGRHMLTAESAPALAPYLGGSNELYVCFVSTRDVAGFEVEGSLSGDDDDDEDYASLVLTLRVVDPGRLVTKIVELEQAEDDDEEDEEDEEPATVEDVIAGEVLDAVAEWLDEGGEGDVQDALPGRVAPALGALGVQLVRVESVDLPED